MPSQFTRWGHIGRFLGVRRHGRECNIFLCKELMWLFGIWCWVINHKKCQVNWISEFFMKYFKIILSIKESPTRRQPAVDLLATLCLLADSSVGCWIIDSPDGESWWRHQMETFSALLAICAGSSPVTGEFPAQRPVMRSFDVFLDLRLNKRFSKQPWGWWFETPSWSLWRQCNNSLSGDYCELLYMQLTKDAP